ncbi:MAG: hypothetical protein HOV81_29480 [Kofleriaceae bacterium]|nr:hypothetical protein [Kofleriaceae bacterium]
MRKLACAVVLVAGCSSSDSGSGHGGAGTLVYAERDSHVIRILDLAASSDRLIDDGAFGSVSIAPDAAHVAYVGADRVVKVADRAGTVTPLEPRSGCNGGTANWVTSGAIVYCIDTPQQRGSMLLPALGSSARFFETPPIVSADGAQVAYVDAKGNLVLEHADGSNPRVLVPSEDPSALFSYRYATMFTPDQQHVIMEDTADYPPRTRIVPLDGGASIDVEDAHFGGTGFVTMVGGGSVFSPDGSEVAMSSTTGLVVVNLATGAKRMLAEYPPRVSSGGAVFLDDGRVAWLRYEDTSVGDLGDFKLGIDVAGPGANEDFAIIEPRDEWWSTIAISPSGFVAVPSEALLVSTDGTVLVPNDTSSESAFHADIVGISADGTGVITSSSTGEIRFVGLNGRVRHLANASRSTGDLWPPSVAFTPAAL